MGSNYDPALLRYPSRNRGVANTALGQASPTKKMNMLAQLNASVRLLALTGLRAKYPNATEEELKRALADLVLGEEQARKVYGGPPFAE